MTSDSPRPTPDAPSDGGLSRALPALDPSLLLAIVGTVAFYAVMWRPEMRDTLLFRYTTAHPVEYVVVTLGLWGGIDIILKLLSFPREIFALRGSLLPPREGRETVERVPELIAALRSQPQWVQDSRAGRRVESALDYLLEHGAGDDYLKHLKFLSEREDDERYARYTLVRFIIGVTPILGFLGTVVHFGTALSGIDINQIADKLGHVVGEMGQAFDTTTAALAASMSMMFSMFLCERIEHHINAAVDRLSEHDLATRFEHRHESLSPFLGVVQTAHEDMLRSISGVLDRQFELWSQGFDGLFRRFDERQQRETSHWSDSLHQMQSRHEGLERQVEDRFAALLSRLEERHAGQLDQIQSSLTDIARLREDVQSVGRVLREIAEGEGQLNELQTSLSNNLHLLNQNQQMEDALHELSAAIHLLTARRRSTAEPDAMAA